VGLDTYLWNKHYESDECGGHSQVGAFFFGIVTFCAFWRFFLFPLLPPSRGRQKTGHHGMNSYAEVVLDCGIGLDS